MADRGGDRPISGREWAREVERRAMVEEQIQESLRHKIEFFQYQLASAEEKIAMEEPLAWRPEISPVDPRRLIRFLRARLAEGGAGKGIPRL
jgi:hypothetical protein